MALSRTSLDLPTRLPVFPLSGVVLMPFGHLPLTIFEPRYIHMIDDALGAARMVAIIQPRQVTPDPVPDDAPLYTIGTAGRIVSFQDPSNGQYLVTLEGLSRFRLGAEQSLLAGRGYRTFDVDYAPFLDDLTPNEASDGPEREQILGLLGDYFAGLGIEADLDSVGEAPFDALLSSLVMSCPFEPREKQALLECQNRTQRAQMLISLFEMAAEGSIEPGAFKH